MNKNTIYIDVKRVQTLRIEVSEDEGFDVPDDKVGFAEFYADIKQDAYDLVRDADWESSAVDIEYGDIRVWIKK